MAMPESGNIPSPQGMTESERQQLLMSGLMYKEQGGYPSELSRLDDAGKVRKAIHEVSAAAVGLPSSVAWETKTIPIAENGDIRLQEIRFVTVSMTELMQVFLYPDSAANKSGAGYYAQAALDGALQGTARDAVMRGETGPGKYSAKEAEEFAIRSGVNGGNLESVVSALTGTVKVEALAVANVLVEEAPRVNARRLMYQAFGEYAQTGGDEKAGSTIFQSPGHSAPIGPDFQAFYSGDNNNRDRATRQIYAAGLSCQQLVDENHDDLLIEGIHYKKDTVGAVEPIKNNVYVGGFNSETFKNWIGAILEKTNGDLLAAYDAWYTAIATGLVAKVAVDGVKVGDPPWVSSLDGWLMHFGNKQRAEAGQDMDGHRVRLVDYKNKTGPSVSVGKYPVSWINSFFDNANLGKTGDTIFDRWWNKGVALGDIPWNVVDQNAGATEEEVKLTGFDGFLYTKMQMFNLLDIIQKVPALADICKYPFWQGIARSIDKAFTVVQGLVYDLDTPENRAKSTVNGVDNYETIRRDGVDFIKMVSDGKNPRIPLIVGILDRFAPSMVKSPTGESPDTGISLRERFTHLSEIGVIRMGYVGNDPTKGNPGVPIETFVQSVVDSGLLTNKQMRKALETAYSKDVLDAMKANSKRVAILFK